MDNVEMAYIDLRLFFEIDREKWEDEEYIHYTPTHVKFVDSYNVTEAGLDSIAESSGQSDLYTVGVSNALMNSLGGGSSDVRF